MPGPFDPHDVWQSIELPNDNPLTIFNDGGTVVEFSDGRKVYKDDCQVHWYEVDDGT